MNRIVLLATVGIAAMFALCGCEDAGDSPDPTIESQEAGGGESAMTKTGDRTTVDLGGGVSMKFVWIEPGRFVMGSEYYEEKPPHQVMISKGLWMGETEVTQGQWVEMMGTSPWEGKKYVKNGADIAATFVNWSDAVAFCAKVREKANERFRLPTEAEWEYACRAGTSTRFSFGDNEAELGDYAWWKGNAVDAGETYAHAVAKKKANPWGLYDMHGNATEWCNDWFGDYPDKPVEDPRGPRIGRARVFRSGSWYNPPRFCQSASRNEYAPDGCGDSSGFRVVLDMN